MATIHKMAGGRVQIALRNMITTPDVFWGPHATSYVLAESPTGQWLHNGQRCALLSIHGNGEVRWPTWPGPSLGCASGDVQAVEHFKLTPYTKEI